MFDDINKEDDTFISSFLFYEGVRLLFIETQAEKSIQNIHRRNVIHHV